MSMPHDISLILTLTGGLGAALVLGFVTQKLRLSPLVGYLLAGILVGPHSPGFVADAGLASQLAEIGIILLMFGVGLHFHLKDLLAVRGIALGGAAVQITLTTLSCMFLLQFWGFSLWAGAVFGMSVSVASTVVLTRVLADNHVLHTPAGHVALGWLVVEDLFTILLLVLLPVVLGAGEGNIWWILGKTLLKLAALTVFTLVAGQRLIPALLGYVARTGTRDLFTLAVIVLALGIAVGSALFFDASMAFGAFLAGMVVGQSDFSARATAEALPLRDAFAVLFFVSVGMLFDPAALLEQWPLFLMALGVIVLLKPLLAFLVCLVARKPLRLAVSVGLSLGQIGEFTFILIALGVSFGLFDSSISNAVIPAALLSITLNPLLFRRVEALTRLLERLGLGARLPRMEHGQTAADDLPRVVVVGFGPVGRSLCRIARAHGMLPVVVEANIDTVRRLRGLGRPAVHGDATQAEVLREAGLEQAQALLLSAPGIPAREVVPIARAINPDLRIFVNTPFASEADSLRGMGVEGAFSGEREVALSMSRFLLDDLGVGRTGLEAELERVREVFDEGPATQKS